MARHQVNVALLNDNCGRVHAEERHGCEVQPLLALRVEHFAALRSVVLARFAAEGQDILSVDEGQRRVEPCRVHLLLWGDVQICISHNAIALGNVLVVPVEHDSTEDVYIAVPGLNGGGSLRSSNFKLFPNEGALCEAQQPAVLTVGLQPI